MKRVPVAVLRRCAGRCNTTAATAASPTVEDTPRAIITADKVNLGSVAPVEMEDLANGRKYVTKDMFCSQVLTFHNEAKQATVEVVPLFHVNVDKWYVANVIDRVKDATKVSTVYLGSPLVTVKETVEPASRNGYSTPVALELSMTSDFPKEIPMANMRKAPQFVQIHTREQYVEFCLNRGMGGLEVLARELKTNPALHTRDSICIVTPPRGAQYLLEHLTADAGWTLSADRMVVAESLNRKYGIFLNFFSRFVKLVIALCCLYNLHHFFSYLERVSRAWDQEKVAKEIPKEELKLYNTWYKPEQDAVLKKLQSACLTAPPGSGEDHRVHDSFYTRKLTWDNFSFPKPMKDRGQKLANHEAVRAVNLLEEQCGSADATLEILKLLKGVAEYGGGGGTVERRLDTSSAKFQANLGVYEASRELVARLGFVDRNGDGYATMPAGVTSDPSVVAAILEGVQRLTPMASPVARAMSPASSCSMSPTRIRGADTTEQKRNPLTRRLPSSKKMSTLTQTAATSDKEAINSAVRDGSAFVCHLCSGVVPVERYDQHMTLWCPQAPDDAGVHDSEDEQPRPVPPPALPEGSKPRRRSDF